MLLGQQTAAHAENNEGLHATTAAPHTVPAAPAKANKKETSCHNHCFSYFMA